MDSVLNQRTVWSVDGCRGCPFTAKTEGQEAWRTLRQKSQEMTYWLMQRHIILELSIAGQELPNTSISTHRAKGACGDRQGIYEISHTHLPTELDKEQCTHHISTSKMHQAFYNWTRSFTLIAFIFTIPSSPTASHWYFLSTASCSTDPRGYRVFLQKHLWDIIILTK